MKGRAIIYTATELTWIEENSKRVRKEAHAEFVSTFGRLDVSLDSFKALCKRKGWLTGRTGRIEKGAIPPNKGKPMPPHVREKCLKTAFKKGRLPHNAKGHGHERVDSKDGYVIMVVAEKNPWSGAATRPVHKHRYLWEKANGKIPEGYALKCLDGNKLNCDPSNWEAVPRGMLPRLNSRWRLSYDKAPPELKPTVMLVAKVEHAACEAKSRGKA